jgi:hypothetical protein
MALTGHVIEQHSTIGRNTIGVNDLRVRPQQVGAPAQPVRQTELILSELPLHARPSLSWIERIPSVVTVARAFAFGGNADRRRPVRTRSYSNLGVGAAL